MASELSALVLLVAVALATGVSAFLALRRRWSFNRGLLALAGLVVLLAAVRVFAVPRHHAMFIDEPTYLEAAQHLLRGDAAAICHRTWEGEATCRDFPKALGWPVQLAVWGAAFGVSTESALALTSLLAACSVGLAAWLALQLAGTVWAGALTALLLAFQPVHLAWGATAETHAAATFWLLAALSGAVAGRSRLAPSLMACAALGLAIATRPAMAVAAPGVALLLATGLIGRDRGAALMGLALSCALGIGAAAPMFALNAELLGPDFLSLAHVDDAWGALLGAHEGLGDTVPWLVAGLVGGVALYARSRRSDALALTVTLALLIVASLAFERFQVRMLTSALALSCPLVVSLTQGRSAIAVGIATLLALVGFSLPGLDRALHPSETQRLETALPQRVAAANLPEGAVILAEWPEVLTPVWGPHAVRLSEVAVEGVTPIAEAAMERPIYLLCDMYCEAGFAGGQGASACADALAGLALEPVAVESLHRRTYGLYRVTGAATSDTAPVGCPFDPPG
jgi:hypothetical protein